MLALSNCRWQKRVLLVFDQSLDTSPLRKQRQWLEQEHAGCVERDLIIAYLTADGSGTLEGERLTVEEAAQLRATLHVPPGQFQALLIGKDGGVKCRSDEPIAPQDLFGVIDAMPMRQREMLWADGGGGSTNIPPDA